MRFLAILKFGNSSNVSFRLGLVSARRVSRMISPRHPSSAPLIHTLDCIHSCESLSTLSHSFVCLTVAIVTVSRVCLFKISQIKRTPRRYVQQFSFIRSNLFNGLYNKVNKKNNKETNVILKSIFPNLILNLILLKKYLKIKS